jgi:hypothetical protein
LRTGDIFCASDDPGCTGSQAALTEGAFANGFEAPAAACHGWIGAAGAQGEGPKEIDKEIDLESDALINLASRAATGSPNRVRQVGAAIFTCDGGEPITACNTFPAGVADLDWRHEG